MTGFGRAELEAPFGKLIVEIQSINRKYLEVAVSLPREFSRFEQDIREQVSKVISRGQVSVRLNFIPKADAAAQSLPDVEMMQSLKKGWEKIADKLGYGKEVVDLRFLVANMPAVQKSDWVKEKDLAPISKCIDKALDAFIEMKKKEGSALTKDLTMRLDELEKMIGTIEKYAPDATKRMKEKLSEKLTEVLKTDIDERLMREVALFAEKVDIAEEITRFHSHIAQFKGLIKGKDGVVGRKMDFLIQELGREVNTIGSKSMEAKISHLVVAMKSELEKIREQVQNLE
jgi:uncharacterized protein (TIGR00255 family)